VVVATSTIKTNRAKKACLAEAAEISSMMAVVSSMSHLYDFYCFLFLLVCTPSLQVTIVVEGVELLTAQDTQHIR